MALVIGDSHADAIATAFLRAEDGLHFRSVSGSLFVEGASWAGRQAQGLRAFTA